MEATNTVEARAVTDGPRFHFFGYYEKTPWDVTGRYLLALETDFMDRRPGPGDVARVCVIDTENGNARRIVGETRAWNWQQGAMLQWVAGSPDTIIYNDRNGNGAEAKFVARILNLQTGVARTLPMPVYAVSPTGREAISLNFSRLFVVRPGYGYAGVPDPWETELCPSEDGLYRVDLQTGETRRILSLAEAAALTQPGPDMDTGKHRFNHAQWNTDGTRFVVLHRWTSGWQWRTRLLTLGSEGGDPRLVSDHAMVSHYDWRDPQSILAWARREAVGNRYFLFDDAPDVVTRPEPPIVGDGILTVDGHCSYAPDPYRRWVLTDTYPDSDGMRTLILFDTETETRHDIGRFWGPTPPDGEIRCDLHPRWSRDGRQVCIDSVHEGGHRRMYVLDVSRITEGRNA